MGVVAVDMSDHEDMSEDEPAQSAYWATNASGKRKREQTDRMTAPDPDANKKSKTDVIGKAGKGTPLSDMPRVIHNLNKESSDSKVLKKLHRVLYGTDGKKTTRKRDIRSFSGTVGIDRDSLEARIGALQGKEMS